MSVRNVNVCFEIVRSIASQYDPRLGSCSLLLGCADANAAHRRKHRQYMHVQHYPGVVCVAGAASRLGKKSLLGLFMHEFGHLLGGATQWQADLTAFQCFGYPIRYDPKDVQFIKL
jgi:hypothetical protein